MELNEHNPFSVIKKEVPLVKKQRIHQRIKIFRNLFKGRVDVYALRWESKNGKSGYTPACQHEWYPTFCQKPIIKCSDCQHRALLPLTRQVIYNHLTGKHTIGLYPLLQDETGWFLAVDFDKSNWQKDVQAFIDTYKECNIPNGFLINFKCEIAMFAIKLHGAVIFLFNFFPTLFLFSHY